MTRSQPFKVIANDNHSEVVQRPKVRFTRIQNLVDGEVIGCATEYNTTFEEQAFLGFARGQNTSCPATWLGDMVEIAGRMASRLKLEARPIAIVTPVAALSHPDAPMAAEAGARRANICTQEIRLEFPDLALLEAEYMRQAYIDGFFSRGFRIGVDARMSWRCPFGSYLGTIVEAIRIDSRAMHELPLLEDRVDAAIGSGTLLYAENASWQDAEALRQLGVEHAISPRLDG